MPDSIADKLSGLSRMTVGEVREQWRATMHEEPRSHNKAYLYKRLAWQVQAQQFSGLSKRAQERLEELLPLAPLWLPMPRAFTPVVRQAPTAGGHPAPGTEIVRRYRNRNLVVRILDSSYEFDGRRFDSLTAIVNVATGGSHQSGPRFFGLKAKETAR